MSSGQSPLRWRKSSYSAGSNSSCVETADASAGVAVRDSKNPAGPALGFAAPSWAAFVGGLRLPRR